MKPNERPIVGLPFQVDGSVKVGVLETADVSDRIPILLESLDFVRFDPAVVRLVVRKGADHQLRIGSVLVGKDLVPRAAVRPGAPFPQLGATDDVVVGDVDDPRLPAVIVAAHEVLAQIPGEKRIGVGRVLPPADVYAAIVVPPVLAAGNRPVREVDLRVVGRRLHAGRENHLILVVHVDGDVRPVEYRVRLRSAIEELDRRLDVRLVGIDRQSDQPPHALTPLGLANPDRLAAVGVFGQRVVDRHESRVAMVVEGAPFDAARKSRRRACRSGRV